MRRLRTRRDPEFYHAWALAHGHCQACGVPAGVARRLRWPGLSRHHLVKLGRSDEDCNLLMLCRRCHDLAEGLTVREGGAVLPTLPLAVCLTLKAVREPLQHNPARLRELRGRPLPTPRPIPEVVEAEYRRWRPGSAALFYRPPQEVGGEVTR